MLIKYYFDRGFIYTEIISHLHRFGIVMSKRTLIRRLKKYGLIRRGFQISDDLYNSVRIRILQLLNGSHSSCGYRSIWHTLRMESIHIPRNVVEHLLRELDPEGV